MSLCCSYGSKNEPIDELSSVLDLEVCNHTLHDCHFLLEKMIFWRKHVDFVPFGVISLGSPIAM